MDSGLLARKLCLAMAREHVLAAEDVIVPQFVGLPSYLDQLAEVASHVGARCVELILLDTVEASGRRFRARIQDPVWAG